MRVILRYYGYIIFITGKTVVQKDGAIFNSETLADSYKIYITADDDTNTTTSYLIVNILRQTQIPMSKFLWIRIMVFNTTFNDISVIQ